MQEEPKYYHIHCICPAVLDIQRKGRSSIMVNVENKKEGGVTTSGSIYEAACLFIGIYLGSIWVRVYIVANTPFCIGTYYFQCTKIGVFRIIFIQPIKKKKKETGQCHIVPYQFTFACTEIGYTASQNLIQPHSKYLINKESPPHPTITHHRQRIRESHEPPHRNTLK